MNLNKSVAEVLEALDRAKAHVPQDFFSKDALQRSVSLQLFIKERFDLQTH
jgi:hypothetical protein